MKPWWRASTEADRGRSSVVPCSSCRARECGTGSSWSSLPSRCRTCPVQLVSLTSFHPGKILTKQSHQLLLTDPFRISRDYGCCPLHWHLRPCQGCCIDHLLWRAYRHLGPPQPYNHLVAGLLAVSLVCWRICQDRAPCRHHRRG